MTLHRTILIGDVLTKIKEIPDSSIDVTATSPPYYGLRDYGIPGQLGQESTFHEYLDKLHAVMTELKRVLKPTGSCWVNMGDSYGSHRSNEEGVAIRHEKQERNPIKGYEKSRLGVPERFYIRCIDDGWIARNHIPWYKASSMPSSVNDRFTNKWESVFFFVKQRKYYFNLDAVRVPQVELDKRGPPRIKDTSGQEMLFDDVVETDERKWIGVPGQPDHGIHRNRSEGQTDFDPGLKQDNTLGADGKPNPTYKGFNDRWKNRKHADVPGQTTHTLSKKNTGGYDMNTGDYLGHPKGRNPGDVFFINPIPFPDAHFATFPVELPKTWLKASCPPGGIVLDPFFGSGTTGVAAEELGMKWIGIELNPKYEIIARKRLEKYLNKKINPE